METYEIHKEREKNEFISKRAIIKNREPELRVWRQSISHRNEVEIERRKEISGRGEWKRSERINENRFHLMTTSTFFHCLLGTRMRSWKKTKKESHAVLWCKQWESIDGGSVELSISRVCVDFEYIKKEAWVWLFFLLTCKFRVRTHYAGCAVRAPMLMMTNNKRALKL